MKQILSALIVMVCFTQTNAQVQFDALSLGKAYPHRGETLSFVFDQKMSPLKNEKSIDIAVYQFTSSGFKVYEPQLKKSGSTWAGTVLLDTNSTAIAFAINGGEVKDNNTGKGYYIPVYNAANQPVQGYYSTASMLYGAGGEYYFGITKDDKKSLKMLEEGMAADPELKNDPAFYSSYLQTTAVANKESGKDIVMAKLREMEMKPTLSEADYGTLINWYGQMKMKPKADSLKLAMRAAYPSGSWVNNDMINRFYRETTASGRIKIYDSLAAIMPAEKFNDNMRSQFKSMIASSFLQEKNDAMFAKYSTEIQPAARYMLYNNTSWAMAEKGENVAAAKKMAAEATTWAKNERMKPTGKKPDNVTTKQWNENRDMTYSMFADTYAFILYNEGNYKTGLPYAKDAATLRKLQDPEYNERYAMLLEKSGAADAKVMTENMVKAGKASAKTKEALKSLYTKEKKSDEGFDKYVAALEEEARIKRRAEIAKSMISNAAPKFALKDWEGNEVSLASLKGKVLVVDFWATWCGPCIASMPGMKKAQEKFAGHDDVKFLFVDTWESVDNKNENSKDFMKKKNYPFFVLMDNEDKMVKDFEVSGIPTKFIIDKNGMVRFKSVGFAGDVDVLADEVAMMVEMAGG